MLEAVHGSSETTTVIRDIGLKLWEEEEFVYASMTAALKQKCSH